MSKKVLAAWCVIISAVIMVLPWSVKVRLYPTSVQEVVKYYSVLSMVPVGVGNWCALSSFLMSAIAAPMAVINMNTNVSKQVTILLIISVNLMLVSWFVFGSFTVISVIAFLLQIVAMGMIKKRK